MSAPGPAQEAEPCGPQPQGAEWTLRVTRVTRSSGLSLIRHPNPPSVLRVNVTGVQNQVGLRDPPSNVTGLRGGPQSTVSP